MNCNICGKRMESGTKICIDCMIKRAETEGVGSGHIPPLENMQDLARIMDMTEEGGKAELNGIESILRVADRLKKGQLEDGKKALHRKDCIKKGNEAGKFNEKES